MKTLRKILSQISAMAMIISPVWAAEPPAPGAAQRLGLSAVVDRILGQSPGVSQAKERVQEAEAGLSEAWLSRLPRLSANSAAMRGDDPVYAFGSLLEQRRFTAQDFAISSLNNPGYLTNIKSSLEIGFPLFTGFQLTDRQKLSRMQVAAAAAEEEASVQMARGRAVEAYLRLVLDAALLENADARIESARAEIDDARRLKARGLVLGSDFYAAEAVMDGLQAQEVRIRSEFSATQLTLSVLMGSSTAPVEPVGSLMEPGYALASLPALIEDALRDRQDLRQASIWESSAGVLKRQETLSLLPRVDAFASVETDTYDFGSNPTNRMIGVRARLPIGDPAYFKRREKVAASERAAQAGRQSLEQAVRVEVSERYQRYQGAVAMLPALRESVEKAGKSLEIFKPLYREGRQSIFDVLRAEDALMKAKAGYLQALFETHAGYAQLRLAAGGLNPSVVGEIEAGLGGAR